MDSSTISITVAICLLIAFLVAIIFLRGKFKKAEVRAGSLSANLSTHDPQRLDINGLNQSSQEEGNELRIRTTNANIQNLKQNGKGKNTLDIGDNE